MEQQRYYRTIQWRDIPIICSPHVSPGVVEFIPGRMEIRTCGDSPYEQIWQVLERSKSLHEQMAQMGVDMQYEPDPPAVPDYLRVSEGL